MENNRKSVRKITIHTLLICCFYLLTPCLLDAGGTVNRGAHEEKSRRSGPIIIDHTCTDISRIPSQWLDQAKQLTIHYAHTSHGGQICSGVENLESLNSTYGFARRASGSEGLPPVEVPPVLRMYDGNPPHTYITPERYWNSSDGRDNTRSVADTGNYNFSMWSWCGQLSGASQAYVESYLGTMNQFETEYPAMGFIHMTGHLDGTGASGNLHQRNEQIRAYCRSNNKILFDFADIERYDPDGTDFLDRAARDTCAYDAGNWADEWCAANPGDPLCDACSCAHSKPLNCNLKARAFWWMMARLAGWNPNGAAPTVSTDQASAVTPSSATVSGTINPNGLDTTYHFQYGATTAYGASTTHTSASSGQAEVSVNAQLTALDADTTYHYRISATNSAGTTSGDDRTFITLTAPHCPDFPGPSPVIRDVDFPPGADCTYTDGTAITIGPNVNIAAGATIILKAPTVLTQSPFHAKRGATVRCVTK